MLDIEKSLEKFNDLPEEIILSVDSDAVANKMKELEEKHQVELSSVIIFITVGDMKMEEIEKYLSIEFGLDNAKVRHIHEDLEKEIFNPLIRRLDFLNTNPAKDTITIDEEKDYLLNMFATDLLSELNNNPIIINAINLRIFNILKHDLNFKNDLENSLYKNQERITEKEFVLDKKKRSPSIENWLKNFIKEKGTASFDNVELTDYVVRSGNSKILSSEEKKIVRKLLLLYRNLKFFPESMPSDDGEGWEILPIEEVSRDIGKEKSTLGPPKTKEEKEIEELQVEGAKYRGGLEKLAIEEEVDKKKQIEDLRIEANKYKEGSLEKMALMEEIKKLEK